jgi:CheY-like chemotaxis protein
MDAVGRLAGGIAHDFNNILTVMRGSLLVAESDLPADHPAYPAIAQINNAWVRARDLVRQILTFGRRQEQDRKVLPLGPAVTEALDMLRSTLPASIRIDYPEGAESLPNTLIDASQVHQVITNLGINAAHAIGRTPGRISVAIDQVNLEADALLSASELPAGEYLRLSFSDTGPGMPAEVRERIFEPFFTTKPQGQGTGLGLSVVRGIMKGHDGAITVYSQPGKGTQFRLYFPIVRSAATPLTSTPTTTRGSGERILYVDDEVALVELAKHLLARLGYTVEGHADMHAAVAAFAAAPQNYDVVLTDLSMPGGSGLDVARQILAIRADVPILLASGYIRPEDADDARRAGIREIIWKPFTAQELGTVIARVLEERRATQARAQG